MAHYAGRARYGVEYFNKVLQFEKPEEMFFNTGAECLYLGLDVLCTVLYLSLMWIWMSVRRL